MFSLSFFTFAALFLARFFLTNHKSTHILVANVPNVTNRPRKMCTTLCSTISGTWPEQKQFTRRAVWKQTGYRENYRERSNEFEQTEHNSHCNRLWPQSNHDVFNEKRQIHIPSGYFGLHAGSNRVRFVLS